ncbi:gastrula zinc finger protein XlCGF46.1-like [Zerene cesonia]|uniref:gastrula zinc finger protein XlCGF46.1-like n=1 Tax=Zerene cesonia TaxID=33412 RepID=UPI0018E520AA|nr:gastrula zinc finger protein XlCGF46.1-like [Zerene cesonia]
MASNLKSCRICLIENCVGGKSFDEDVNLLQLFEFCSGLHIGKSSPRLLCEICQEELHRFAKFKKKCTESELFWESLKNCDTIKNEDQSNIIKKEKNLVDEYGLNIESVIYESLCDNGNASDVDKNYAESPTDYKHLEDSLAKNKFREKPLGKLKTKKKTVLKTVTVRDIQERNTCCGLCNISCSNTEVLNNHLSEHLAQGNLKCQICDYIGQDFADLVTHRYKHEPSTIFSCFLCKVRKGSLLSLEFHFRHTHLNKVGGWCAECGKSFEIFNTWRRHMLVHKPNKELLVCDYCGKRYIYKYQIEEHIIHHLRKSQYVCETCGKGFHKKFNLKSHQRNIHRSSVPVKCSHCHKTYKNRESLDVHLKEVKRDKPYICEICSKRFSLPSNLKNHLFFHTGQKPFECDVCGLKYKTKSSLKSHKLKHLGIYKFKCSNCVRCFTTSVQLRRHSTIHTGIRKFKCAHCDKSFNERYRLEAHSAKHTELQLKTEGLGAENKTF